MFQYVAIYVICKKVLSEFTLHLFTPISYWSINVL